MTGTKDIPEKGCDFELDEVHECYREVTGKREYEPLEYRVGKKLTDSIEERTEKLPYPITDFIGFTATVPVYLAGTIGRGLEQNWKALKQKLEDYRQTSTEDREDRRIEQVKQALEPEEGFQRKHQNRESLTADD